MPTSVRAPPPPPPSKGSPLLLFDTNNISSNRVLELETPQSITESPPLPLSKVYLSRKPTLGGSAAEQELDTMVLIGQTKVAPSSAAPPSSPLTSKKTSLQNTRLPKRLMSRPPPRLSELSTMATSPPIPEKTKLPPQNFPTLNEDTTSSLTSRPAGKQVLPSHLHSGASRHHPYSRPQQTQMSSSSEGVQHNLDESGNSAQDVSQQRLRRRQGSNPTLPRDFSQQDSKPQPQQFQNKNIPPKDRQRSLQQPPQNKLHHHSPSNFQQRKSFVQRQRPNSPVHQRQQPQQQFLKQRRHSEQPTRQQNAQQQQQMQHLNPQYYISQYNKYISQYNSKMAIDEIPTKDDDGEVAESGLNSAPNQSNKDVAPSGDTPPQVRNFVSSASVATLTAALAAIDKNMEKTSNLLQSDSRLDVAAGTKEATSDRLAKSAQNLETPSKLESLAGNTAHNASFPARKRAERRQLRGFILEEEEEEEDDVLDENSDSEEKKCEKLDEEIQLEVKEDVKQKEILQDEDAVQRTKICIERHCLNDSTDALGGVEKNYESDASEECDNVSCSIGSECSDDDEDDEESSEDREGSSDDLILSGDFSEDVDDIIGCEVDADEEDIDSVLAMAKRLEETSLGSASHYIHESEFNESDCYNALESKIEFRKRRSTKEEPDEVKHIVDEAPEELERVKEMRDSSRDEVKTSVQSEHKVPQVIRAKIKKQSTSEGIQRVKSGKLETLIEGQDGQRIPPPPRNKSKKKKQDHGSSTNSFSVNDILDFENSELWNGKEDSEESPEMTQSNGVQGSRNEKHACEDGRATAVKKENRADAYKSASCSVLNNTENRIVLHKDNQQWKWQSEGGDLGCLALTAPQHNQPDQPDKKDIPDSTEKGNSALENSERTGERKHRRSSRTKHSSHRQSTNSIRRDPHVTEASKRDQQKLKRSHSSGTKTMQISSSAINQITLDGNLDPDSALVIAKQLEAWAEEQKSSSRTNLAPTKETTTSEARAMPKRRSSRACQHDLVRSNSRADNGAKFGDKVLDSIPLDGNLSSEAILTIAKRLERWVEDPPGVSASETQPSQPNPPGKPKIERKVSNGDQSSGGNDVTNRPRSNSYGSKGKKLSASERRRIHMEEVKQKLKQEREQKQGNQKAPARRKSLNGRAASNNDIQNDHSNSQRSLGKSDTPQEKPDVQQKKAGLFGRFKCKIKEIKDIRNSTSTTTTNTTAFDSTAMSVNSRDSKKSCKSGKSNKSGKSMLSRSSRKSTRSVASGKSFKSSGSKFSLKVSFSGSTGKVPSKKTKDQAAYSQPMRPTRQESQNLEAEHHPPTQQPPNKSPPEAALPHNSSGATQKRHSKTSQKSTKESAIRLSSELRNDFRKSIGSASSVGNDSNCTGINSFAAAAALFQEQCVIPDDIKMRSTSFDDMSSCDSSISEDSWSSASSWGDDYDDKYDEDEREEKQRDSDDDAARRKKASVMQAVNYLNKRKKTKMEKVTNAARAKLRSTLPT